MNFDAMTLIIGTMKPKFDKGTEARRRARQAAPKAGATKKINDKRFKPLKHKKPLHDFLGEQLKDLSD